MIDWDAEDQSTVLSVAWHAHRNVIGILAVLQGEVCQAACYWLPTQEKNRGSWLLEFHLRSGAIVGHSHLQGALSAAYNSGTGEVGC